MARYFTKNRKNGFTVVELVIVIAVIAILAAILIPTFNSVIKKAKKSTDIRVVANMNKALAIDSVAAKTGVDFAHAKSVIEDGGYKLPRKPDSEDLIFYWMAEENRVVLYDTRKIAVIFPETDADKVKTDRWVDLSVGADDPADQPGGEPSDDPPDVPTDEPTVTENRLLSGTQFRAAVEGLCSSPTKIVFGKTADYAEKTAGNSVSVAAEGDIKAYVSGTEIYVLSPGTVVFPKDSSAMFAKFTGLKSVRFDGIDTAGVTDMSQLFYQCKALEKLDLSAFSTAKVTNMTKMFQDCAKLEVIWVDETGWTTAAVNASKDMFRGCTELSVKRTGGFWTLLFEVLPDVVPDSVYDATHANTGSDGYLTAK